MTQHIFAGYFVIGLHLCLFDRNVLSGSTENDYPGTWLTFTV